MKNINRRNFIKKTAVSGTAVATGALMTGCATPKPVAESGGLYMGGFSAPKLETVRAAFIGVGYRGPNHLRFLAKLDGFEVVAISDLYEDNVKKEVKFCQEVGAGQRHQKIAEYWGSEDKWRQMLDEVNRTGEELKITRHGQPLAIISPVSQEEPRNGFGIAKGTIEIKGDIIEPVVESYDWEVLN